MTYDEMKAEAENAIRPLVASRQRGWVMKNEELTVLLITAYCKGHLSGVDKSVANFAPERFTEYKKLAGR